MTKKVENQYEKENNVNR